MSGARRAHGGVAEQNGRLLVLVRGGAGRPTSLPMTEVDPTQHPLTRELGGFLSAVFVGSLGGLVAGQLLARWVGPATAGPFALAVGTTLTAATHACLVHGLRARALVPRVLLAAPLAYAVMRVVHGVLGR